MFLELAKSASLLASIVSLCALFHATFLGLETNLEERLWNILGMLIVATAISFLSGELFRAKQSPTRTSDSLTATLPVKLFLWAIGIMLILFLVAWYLETHYIFYKDIRY
jgi:hypothetical protein